MKITFIYSLSDPRTGHVRYIGKSNNPKRRLVGGHLPSIHDKRNKTKKRSWLKNVIDSGNRPILEIIDVVSCEEWEFWESYYISLYRSWGFNLTNLTNGGGGSLGGSWNKGRRHSVETIEKIKERRKHQKVIRRVINEKEREKCREAIKILHEKRKGQKDSEETKLKRGKSVSISLKKSYSEGRITAWNKGKKMDKEFILKNYPFKKPVVKLSLENVLIDTYNSAAEAAKTDATYSKSKIGKCCLKKQSTHRGFRWLFLKEYLK